MIGLGQDGGIDLVALIEVLELLEKLRLGGMRGMWFMHGNVNEEGLILVLFHKRDGCVVGAGVEGVDLRARPIEYSGFIIPVFSRHRRIITSFVGQVPLAKVSGFVAGLLEQAGEHDRIGIQPIRHSAFLVVVRIGKVLVNAVPGWVLPRQDGGSAGRTYCRGDCELGELRSLCGQSIQIGRFVVLVPMTAQVAPTPVIGEEKENVRPARSSLRGGG